MHDTRTEASIFASLLTLPECRAEVFATISPEDLSPDGAQILTYLHRCYAAGTIETSEVFTHCHTWVRSADTRNWWEAMETLIEISMRGRVAKSAEKLTAAAMSMETPLHEIVALAAQMPTTANDSRHSDGETPVHAIVDALIAKTEQSLTIEPVKTGLSVIDSRILLHGDSGYMVIGARPSIGKTALALSILQSMRRAGKSVGFFSFEMPNVAVLARLACMESGVKYRTIMNGCKDQPELRERYMDALSDLRACENLRIWGDGKRKTAAQFAEKAKHWTKNCGVDALAADYFQIFDHRPEPSSRNATRYEKTTYTSEVCADTCHELGVPLLMLAQLKRPDSHSTRPRRPRMEDLKETGALEQDADSIVLIDRPHAGNEPSPHNYTRKGAAVDMTHKAALIIPKNRNGETGMGIVNYQSETMQFHEDRQPEEPVLQAWP